MAMNLTLRRFKPNTVEEALNALIPSKKPGMESEITERSAALRPVFGEKVD